MGFYCIWTSSKGQKEKKKSSKNLALLSTDKRTREVGAKQGQAIRHQKGGKKS
jgi:hypothetical protein